MVVVAVAVVIMTKTVETILNKVLTNLLTHPLKHLHLQLMLVTLMPNVCFKLDFIHDDTADSL